MARKNRNGYPERRFDTRMSLKQICRVLGVTPYQRIKLMKYIKQNDKGGGHTNH